MGRKLQVGIIFGGRSGEHEVSLRSARSVIAKLDRQKYDVFMIGITKSGRWLTGNVVEALEAGTENVAQPAAFLPDPLSAALMTMDLSNADLANLSEVAHLDVVMPILHGPFGEDGTVQGLFELADIAYVGAGVVGSAVGMDKAIFKSVMMAGDMPVVPWKLVLRSTWLTSRDSTLNDIETQLDYPVFVKPANLGSSVGINKCRDRDELVHGLDEASHYDRRIIVEKGLNARELEVSVLGNDNPIASVVGEIRPRRDFYDYVAKYLTEPGSDEDSELIIPADLPNDVSEEVRAMAVKAYMAIDCAGLGRADFLLDKQNGRLYINEINTIPGFTSISMYPKLWEETGISYPELLDRLIGLALERHEEKKNLDTHLNLNELK